MKTTLLAAGMGTAIAFTAFAPDAVAQEIVATYSCQDIGMGAPEPLGDREGHAITVGQYSCRVDSGPMSGGVGTGTNVWEWDGPNAVQRSSSSVIRKPGATAVWMGTSGKLTANGFTGSGTGTYVVATGSAASMAGKTTNWTAKSTGMFTFTVEEKQ